MNADGTTELEGNPEFHGSAEVIKEISLPAQTGCLTIKTVQNEFAFSNSTISDLPFLFPGNWSNTDRHRDSTKSCSMH
jgi:hypothetical protein